MDDRAPYLGPPRVVKSSCCGGGCVVQQAWTTDSRRYRSTSERLRSVLLAQDGWRTDPVAHI